MKDWKVGSADFSYSDVSGVGWRACQFKDVLLRRAGMRSSGMVNCRFEHVDLGGADLRGSVLGGCKAPGFSEYIGCSFEAADLRDTLYEYPIFRDCDFSGARLDGVDFGWSRFARCKFAGRIQGATFRGSFSRSSRREREELVRLGVQPEAIVNSMEGVDFSAAYLDDVTFTHGISLDTCVFPHDQDLIIIRNRELTYRAVQDAIKSRWREPDKSEALNVLALLSSDKAKVGQTMDVINRRSYEPLVASEGRAWAAEFFELLQKTASAGE